MKINRENYSNIIEAYAHGLLSDEQERQLFEFLELHPDLEVKFDDEQQLFPDYDISMEKSALIFDQINTSNRTYFFIAYLEDELSTEQKIQVDNWLQQNPKYQKEFSSFQQTKLKPEEKVFPSKKSILFFPEKHLFQPIWKYSAAFLLLFLVFVGYWIGTDKSKDVLEIETKEQAVAEVIENKKEFSLEEQKIEMEEQIPLEKKVKAEELSILEKPNLEIQKQEANLDKTNYAENESVIDSVEKKELDNSRESQRLPKGNNIASPQLAQIENYLEHRELVFFAQDESLIAEQKNLHNEKARTSKFGNRLKKIASVGKVVIPVLTTAIAEQISKTKEKYRTTENGVTRTNITFLGITIERTRNR